MNGRIYDPELGRFLSPDPIVQIPEYSQNFNRYSYVLNNPLNATDPSGFSFISKAFSKIGSFIKENWRTIANIVFAAVLFVIIGPGAFMGMFQGGMFASGWAVGASIGGLTGAFNAAINGGNLGDVLRAAVVGALQGSISGGILSGWESAGWNLQTLQHVAGHGVLGGAANEALGGKFQDGFLSAAASTAAGDLGFLGDPSDTGMAAVASRTAKASVVGGTASVLGGGKFANGAYTAAFQHLLNAESKNVLNAIKLQYAEDFLEVATSYIGLNEHGSNADKELINKFHRSTSLPASMVNPSTAWCSSFVNYILEITGNVGTNSAGSQSWLRWGSDTKGPALGALAVFTDYDLKWNKTNQGHVGFVAGILSNGRISVLGGNQGDKVKYSDYGYTDKRYSKGVHIGYRKLTSFRVPNIPNRQLLVAPTINFYISNPQESTR